MTRAFLGAFLCAALLSWALPASARVGVLQVTNETDRCALITIYAAQDTSSSMYQLGYQKPRFLKPGASDAFSAMKGQLAAMHVLVRAYFTKAPDCSGGILSVAHGAYLSPKAALEVPTAKIVPYGPREVRVVFPGQTPAPLPH